MTDGLYLDYLTNEQENELKHICSKLLVPGKGILAADESIETIEKRFNAIQLENSICNRVKYRELLFTASNISDNISGIILHEETFYQASFNGERLVDIIRKKGLIPGIKLDSGTVTLPGTMNEVTTQGLDNLAKRCVEFKKGGCDFAKWRCVFKIQSHTPSHFAVKENSNILARYAVICQQNGLVPIIEPEILYDGDHDIGRCQKVTEKTFSYIYRALSDHNVLLEGTLLKANMVTPGKSYKGICTPEEIGLATVTTLRRSVPSAVPGIVFLSGGQSELDATRNLNVINKCTLVKPWVLTFSFGRALQTSAIDAWKGEDTNIKVAQDVLLKRAKANGDASLGKYVDESLSSTEKG